MGSSAILTLLLFLISSPFSLLALEPEVLLQETNATADSNASLPRSNEDSFANIIDRALEREFPENEQNQGSWIYLLPLCAQNSSAQAFLSFLYFFFSFLLFLSACGNLRHWCLRLDFEFENAVQLEFAYSIFFF